MPSFTWAGVGRRATVKAIAPSRPPAMSSWVRTITRSPGRNGCSGTKLAPLPSECACRVPACAPLRAPVTVTGPSSAAGAPRNVTCASGRATCEPGVGNVVTLAVLTWAVPWAAPAPNAAAATTAVANAILRFEVTTGSAPPSCPPAPL